MKAYQLKSGEENSIFLPCFFFSDGTTSHEYLISLWANFGKEYKITVQTKYIFIPINIDNGHWVLIIVETKSKSFSLFDSQPSDHNTESATRRVHYWLNCIPVFQNISWKVCIMSEIYPKDFPTKGNNVTECGVFVMMYADFFVDNLHMDFDLLEMKIFRKKIYCDLHRGAVNYDLMLKYSSLYSVELVNYTQNNRLAK